MDFLKKYKATALANKSYLCIGLDPELSDIKVRTSIFNFNKFVIDKTFHLVSAYKPNIAFYESEGISGLKQLKKTIEYMKKKHPKIPVILDAKRADVPNTAKHYAKAVFDYWQADAVTVYPHLGLDSITPYLRYKNKLTILLLKTSNPDSSKMQKMVKDHEYYYFLAKKIKTWKMKNIGLFVGATYPQDLQKIRKLFPNNFFLTAGVGAQGANLKSVVKASLSRNHSNIAINVSRSVIFANDPAKEAQKLRDEINSYL